MVIENIGKNTFELAENPLWLDSENSFFWVDIEKGTLYKYNLQKKEIECILTTQFRIGAFAFDESENIILLTEKGLIKAYRNDNKKYILDKEFLINYPLINERFNDAICDMKGRIIAGIKSDDNSSRGRVVVFEKEKEPRTIINNVYISNGMGFSKDNNFFYHTDSILKQIYQYDYNVELGIISNKKVVYEHQGSGVPDGMTIDCDDNILTCIWGEGKLLKIVPNRGNTINNISLPCKLSSSLTFGGFSLDVVLLTSANISLSKDEISKYDGAVYLINNYDCGKKEYKAKI